MPNPTEPNSSLTAALEALLDSLDGDTFQEWFEDKKHRENIQNGTPYFNNDDYVPTKQRHTPSQLLQCHRKLLYRQLNAPRETANNDGIFFLGDVLENLVEEFLIDLGREHDLHIQNSMYVKVEDARADPMVRFRGETDPVICDYEGVPVLPTEIKSKSEEAFTYLSSASTRHQAQVHAYVQGLNDRLDALRGDRQLSEFAVIYIARESLDVKVFHHEFDRDFWESIVEWARTHTAYRERSEESTAALDDDSSVEREGSVLPPAYPLEDWECKYCAFAKRCGKNEDIPVRDLGAAGFLPLTEYSRSAVKAHMEAFPSVPVTPTLAHHYPSLLADGHPVAPWQCRKCGEIPLDRVGWDRDITEPPTCPECEQCSLRGPLPEQADQISSGGGSDEDGV